jgi:hypothetical protein
MAFLIHQALIVHLMDLPTIILIVSLKRQFKLILAGYIQQVKSRNMIQPRGDIYGAVIAIFEKGICRNSSCSSLLRLSQGITLLRLSQGIMRLA